MNTSMMGVLAVFLLLPWHFALQRAQEGEQVNANDSSIEVVYDIRHVVYRLARAYDTSIGFEQAWPASDPGIKPTDIADPQIQASVQALLQNTADRTVEETLDEFVAIAAEYTWKEDVNSGVINVVPVDNSRLERRIERLSIEDKTVQQIFQEEDVLNLGELGIHFDPGRGRLTWLEATISLEANDITTMEALNLLTKELPFPARWEVFYMGEKPGAMGILMIGGYGKQPGTSVKRK